METGLSHSSRMKVDERHLAVNAGSGDLPVLATPAMLALMENAAMLAVAPALDESDTTVGGRISATHLRPTAPGDEVEATATLTEVDGRKLTFRVEARDSKGPIGEGTHTRFVVNRVRFMGKL